MWSPDEMDEICQALRAETEGRVGVQRQKADDELVDRIADFLSSAAAVPVEELRERLWMIGWVIYEASWQALGRSEAARVRRLAELARRMPWPQLAPRALGAIRAEALMWSGLDTPRGYDEAYQRHREARRLRSSYERDLGEQERLGIREISLQLAVSEIGTACRAAEQIIGRWPSGLDEGYWVPTNFQRLYEAATVGEQALGTAAAIEAEHGFTGRADRRRLAPRTTFRNLGIATARAALHLIPLSYAMEELSLRPPAEYETWAQTREETMRRFRAGYAAIEREVTTPMPLARDHKRSVVQLRLEAALVLPGIDLPSKLDFAGCVTIDPLDERAVSALSSWLSSVDERGRMRGDANLIGSATMPAFIRGVEISRAAYGVAGGYREWRDAWPSLDGCGQSRGIVTPEWSTGPHPVHGWGS
jgi:hypothetical protein